MTFFEKEMRKLFQHGLSFQETIFAGRACYGNEQAVCPFHDLQSPDGEAPV